MIAQVMRQTDREKINALMRNIYTRLRSEHYGVPVVYLHSPYATSKTLGKWNPGTVMYDLFFDELASRQVGRGALGRRPRDAPLRRCSGCSSR